MAVYHVTTGDNLARYYYNEELGDDVAFKSGILVNVKELDDGNYWYSVWLASDPTAKITNFTNPSLLSWQNLIDPLRYKLGLEGYFTKVTT